MRGNNEASAQGLREEGIQSGARLPSDYGAIKLASFIGLAVLGASLQLAGAVSGSQFLGQPGTHSLYVLNEDGNLFRWGESRGSGVSSTPWPSVVPYYEAMVAVPPSPTGARWVDAAGFQDWEMLLDAAGRVYLNALSMTAPTRLTELPHPEAGRSWRGMANSMGAGLLVDDVGALYRAEVWPALQYLIEHPGAPLPLAHSWFTMLPSPSAEETIQRAEVAGWNSLLALTAGGELYGRGYNSSGLTGNSAGEDWVKLVRPAGVPAWRSFRTSGNATVAWGEGGEVYYWGQRILGSSFAGPGTELSVPTAIPKPPGVTGWVSADVTGGLVFLVSREGGLYVFGSGFHFLQFPVTGTSGGQLVGPTPVDHPALIGEFSSVHCGVDYVIARKADGTDVRWGKFTRLQDGSTADAPPQPMEIPAAITDSLQRLAPAARILNPGNFSDQRLGEPVRLQAEVFPLAGTLATVQFLLNNSPVSGAVQLEGNVATLAWLHPWPGPQELRVRVIDSAGRVTTSPATTFKLRHAVEWTISTNRISEPGGHDQLTTAQLSLTRTELPYPQYHEFTYRFVIEPATQRDVDYAVTGATVAADGSGHWEVVFPRGQKTATVAITALADQFTESNLGLTILPSYHWVEARDYLPPEDYLQLEIIDTTFTGGPSPVVILADPATHFSFQGDTVPLTVSVPKSLTTTPVVQLTGLGHHQYEHIHSEDLPDRRLVHFELRNLEAGLREVRARAYSGWNWGFNRYRDSDPVAIRVWDRAGLPMVRVVALERTVDEAGAPPVVVTVERDGPVTEPATVKLSIRGTALNGADYDLLPTTVVIPAGASYTTLTVQVRDDDHPEMQETIIISAVQDSCADLAGCQLAEGASTARIDIRDNAQDTSPVVPGAQVVASPSSSASYLITASGQLYAWGDNEGGQLGLGELPVELIGRVPWPRRLREPEDQSKWREVFPGARQAFGRSQAGTLFAWGHHFANVVGPFTLNSPRPLFSVPTNLVPWFVREGALVTQASSGRLQTYRLSSYSPHHLYLHDEPGLRGLRFTPQLRVLSEEGYFHPASDWHGRYPERYPLPADAGYWLDAASAGEHLVALDELGRLHQVYAGGYVFDPVRRRTQRAYSTVPRTPLPEGRKVARLLGNEIAILALATDGAAFALTAPNAGAEVIPMPDGVSRWTSLAAGARHFLAVGDDGNVYAWGENELGQLGDGTVEPAAGPRRLPVFSGVNDPAIELPTVNLALPPRVEFHGLSDDLRFDGPTSLPAAARAFDPDGLIERVEFLLNGEPVVVAVFDSQTLTFKAVVPLPEPGEHLLTARAWDDSGLFTDTAPLRIQVDDPGLYPIVKVWNMPSGTAEGFGVPGNFVISRQGIAQVPLTVYFDIHGTATEGVDYPALPRSVIIPAGAAEVRIPIIARPDFVDEPTEVVELTILNPGCDPDTAEPGSGCYRIGTPHTAPVFIVDYLRPGDARLPFVSLTLLEPIAREGTTNLARIEVRRTGSRVEDLPVYYELGGDAQNGIDYAPLSGLAVIPAGAAHTTIDIVAIEDYVVEPFERVIVTLLNPGCDVGTGSAEQCYRSDAGNIAVAYVADKPVPPPPPPGLPGLNVTPRPVYFAGLERLAGQGTMLNLVSDPGARFTLQVSSDLHTWHDLGELTSVSGQMEFLDVDAAQVPTRYYRVVPAPEP